MHKIALHNVRQNNLNIPFVEIPLRELVVFVGPSGSGKSSLAIDTLLAEGQRRCIEALRASIRLDNKRIARPQADRITGLPPTFGMRQDIGIKFDRHTGLADLLGIQTLLEHLFLEWGTLHCPKTNEPLSTFTPLEATEYLLQSHDNMAAHIVSKLPVNSETYLGILEELIRNGHTRIQYDDTFPFIEDAPKLPPKKFGVVLDRLKVREKNRDRLREALRHGLNSHQQQIHVILSRKGDKPIEKIFSSVPQSADGTMYPTPTAEHLQTNTSLGGCVACYGLGVNESTKNCTLCNGTGLQDFSDLLKIQDLSFRQAIAQSPKKLRQWLKTLNRDSGELLELERSLQLLCDFNLQNPLCQKVNSLSTGERSRARTSAVLNQELGTCLYILDEPSLGLDNANVDRLIEALRRKVDEGQSFIVVDHHPKFQQSADTVFHFGPGSGIHGGTIIQEDALKETIDPTEFANKAFSKSISIGKTNFELYLGGLHIITGPSGSGKTRLLKQIHQTLKEQDRPERILLLTSLGSLGNKRSTLVTIAGIWTEIRNLMASTRSAKLHRLSAADFSFNRKGGRCEACHGIGTIPHHVAPLPPSEVTCSECLGKRFLDSTLQATYRDRNISEILDLSVDEALKIFEHQPMLFRMCSALQMVGLGYLTLGQSSPTLSGGEHRRIQLAQVLAPCLTPEFKREPLIVLMDDPTAALHASDALRLQRCLLHFRRDDITIVMTSTNQQMLEIADFVTTLT